MKHQKYWFLFSLFALFMTGISYAGNRPGAWTITPSVGYYFFAAKRSIYNTTLPNLAFAYNFDEHWAGEVDAGVINTNNSSEQGVHGMLYTVDGIYRFMPRGNFEPYALAGVGVIGLKPPGNTSTQQALINAGIGTQYFIDPSIALRADVRDLYTMSGGYNEGMINFGVSFLIGGN